jgi:DNA-binding LytR/AlgR family response regulator
MKILLIEDEPQAAQRLEKLVTAIVPDARVLAKIDTVKKAVQWFQSNPPPDLVLMDIQLADGISFSIFDQCEVKAPVIFTTAYDEYALKAFKVNSIDYILKPVDEKELKAALNKFESVTSQRASSHDKIMESISLTMQMLSKKYKERFVVKVGEHLKTIEVSEILYFFSLEKTTFAQTNEARKYILDFTLDQIEELVDPNKYFRINRKYIVAIDSIKDMISYTNSRLKLLLIASEDVDVIVARERVQEFREWLDQ